MQLCVLCAAGWSGLGPVRRDTEVLAFEHGPVTLVKRHSSSRWALTSPGQYGVTVSYGEIGRAHV